MPHSMRMGEQGIASSPTTLRISRASGTDYVAKRISCMRVPRAQGKQTSGTSDGRLCGDTRLCSGLYASSVFGAPMKIGLLLILLFLSISANVMQSIDNWNLDYCLKQEQGLRDQSDTELRKSQARVFNDDQHIAFLLSRCNK